MNIVDYQTIIFDCDGVVLNSNKIKTDAFYQAALPYGEAAAQGLADYHIAHGGISRYKKFEWFIQNIAANTIGPNIDELLASYAAQVRYGLLNCDVAEGLTELREKTRSAKWLIVSGGDQQELREVFAVRGIASLFDGGIFGSPDNKDTILERELLNGNIGRPALFLGDSKYDYQASTSAGIDCIFLTGWTEVRDWQNFCEANSIRSISSLKYFI